MLPQSNRCKKRDESLDWNGRLIAARRVMLVCAGVLMTSVAADGQDRTPPLAPTPDGGAAVAPGAVDAPAEKPAASSDASDSIDQRREWLRARFVADVTSERRLRVINTRMDDMSDRDVNRAYLREQKKVAKKDAAIAAQEQAAAQARSIAQQRQWQDALAFPVAPQRPAFGRRFGDVVGFAPVVDWLPGGTQLSVGPDGIALQTGNPYGGSYTPYYHPYGCTCRTCGRGVTVTRKRVVAPPEKKPEIWYDGLRTRRGDR